MLDTHTLRKVTSLIQHLKVVRPKVRPVGKIGLRSNTAFARAQSIIHTNARKMFKFFFR